MDTAKLSEVFATLKSLLTTGTGKQWEDRAAKSRQPVPAGEGWYEGASEEDIVLAAEETRLHALGLNDQYRFTRKDKFSCGAHPVSTPHHLGQMALDGRQFYLGQTLTANRHQWLLGRRCLLELGAHVGRKVDVAWKIGDGYNHLGHYQVAHECKKPYTILRHGAGWIELDRALEVWATGYLFLTFT